MGTFSANLPAFSGFRNLVVDLPRFGQSDRPDIQGSRIAYTAERVSQALTTLGVDRVSVVGISYGAGVALKLAAERPELVERIVAVASGSAYPDGWTPTEPLRHIVTYMTGSDPSPELMRRIFTAAAYDKSLVTEELLDERMTLARRNHPELPSVAGESGLNADLPGVSAPVLLLWGREDQFLGLDIALHVIRLIPDCELRVLPRCGHWVQADAPDRFNQIVLEFMETEQ